MRVAVTGGTGYVGAYTVQALLAAGHQPRLLVRSRDKLAPPVGALGGDVQALDVVDGDMTDADAVRVLVDGCDAAIHGAAVVAALNRSDGQRTIDVNVGGTRTVLDAAIAAGCDPVVHVSSVAAVFQPSAPLITADLPPATCSDSPYTRSKALAEELARTRQAQGKPVVIVYPGGVNGPAVGELYGEVAEGFVSMLKTGALVTGDGGIAVIDVRDLAQVIVATLTPGLGARGFGVGGQFVPLPEIAAVIRRTTGRRFPVVPTPGAVLRGLGHVTDVVRRVVPFDTVFTAEAMDLLPLARPTDDSAVHDQLGVTYRDPA